MDLNLLLGPRWLTIMRCIIVIAVVAQYWRLRAVPIEHSCFPDPINYFWVPWVMELRLSSPVTFCVASLHTAADILHRLLLFSLFKHKCAIHF